MNLVFVGASSLGLEVLQGILATDEIRVTGVISAEDEFEISYSSSKVKNVLHADLAEFCRRNGVPILFSRRGFSDLSLEYVIEEFKPDVFLVAGWYHMIPKTWRDQSLFLGIHASLLPKYSGGAPLVWALINGEHQAGVTIFQLDGGVDSGPIVAQNSFQIGPKDDIATVLRRATDLSVALAQRVVSQLVRGNLDFQPQDEQARTLFPQRNPEDGIIDPTISAEELVRFVRAQTRPYPGAFFQSAAGRLRVWKVESLPPLATQIANCGFRQELDKLQFLSQSGGLLEIVDFALEPNSQVLGLEDFIRDFNDSFRASRQTHDKN